MHTLYWIPSGDEPKPRFNAYDEKGRRYLVPPRKVPGVKDALMFEFPDNQKNNHRLVNIQPPWYSDLPNQANQPKTSQQTILKKESSQVEDSNKTPITREELIQILENNGTSFRRNQKTETLWEKLPNDIAGNFKLVESSTEV